MMDPNGVPSDVAVILQKAAELSPENQMMLNRHLVDMIKRKRRIAAAQIGAKFTVGQVLKFMSRGRTAGVHYLRVTGFNRAGTAVVGKPCDKNGLPLVNSRINKWTVGTTLCTVHQVET